MTGEQTPFFLSERRKPSGPATRHGSGGDAMAVIFRPSLTAPVSNRRTLHEISSCKPCSCEGIRRKRKSWPSLSSRCSRPVDALCASVFQSPFFLTIESAGRCDTLPVTTCGSTTWHSALTLFTFGPSVPARDGSRCCGCRTSDCSGLRENRRFLVAALRWRRPSKRSPESCCPAAQFVGEDRTEMRNF